MVAEPIHAKPRCVRHIWTPEELAYLKQWYGVIPTKRLAAHFGVNVLAIYHAREKYMAPFVAHAKPRRWTEAEDDCLRREYAQTHASRDNLAGKLERTPASVGRRCSQLGLTKRIDYRQSWTLEEDEVAREWIGAGKTITQIAKQLNRTEGAIRIHANRYMNMGLRNSRAGWRTKTEVCAVLGVDHKWAQRRIDSGALKATWHRGVEPQKTGQAEWHITDAALRDFIRRYPDELNGRNVDLPQIVELLAGILSGRERD